MAAGDLLTSPGQIEWGGLLFDVWGPDESGYWLHAEATEVDGFDVEYDADDLPTVTGVAPGIMVPQAMYPSVIGLCVETAGQVAALKAAMAPTLTTAPLCWWDREADVRWSVDALPRRCVRANLKRQRHAQHRMFDLQWLVAQPGSIVDLDES